MSSRRIKKSNAFYHRAISGETAPDGTRFLGLRSVAKGFTAADGFDLRHIDDWTPSQKARVTKYFHEMERLTAQTRYVYRARNKQHLEQAQRTSGHDKGFHFKVAFIPYTPEEDKSGKIKPPKIKFLKEGIRIKQSRFDKIKIPFNFRNLVRDPKKEIFRAIEQNAPRASAFAVDAGGNEMKGLYSKDLIVDNVINLMEKYDGVKPLPRSSGNYGDAPEFHSADKWLLGLDGYEFPPRTNKIKRLQSTVSRFDDENARWKKKRANLRRRHKMKGD